MTSNAVFDYERQKIYRFRVRASDAGNSPRYTDSLVNVLITDLQDSIPLFENTRYEQTVREDAPLSTIVLSIPVSLTTFSDLSPLWLTNYS